MSIHPFPCNFYPRVLVLPCGGRCSQERTNKVTQWRFLWKYLLRQREGGFNISPMSLDEWSQLQGAVSDCWLREAHSRIKEEQDSGAESPICRKFLKPQSHGCIPRDQRFPCQFIFKRTLLQPLLWNHRLGPSMLRQPWEPLNPTLCPIWQMETLRPREGNRIAQGSTVS